MNLSIGLVAVLLAAIVVVIVIGISVNPGELSVSSNNSTRQQSRTKVDLVSPSRREDALRALRNRTVPPDHPMFMRLAFMSGEDYASFSSLKANAEQIDAIIPDWVDVSLSGNDVSLRRDPEAGKVKTWLRQNARRIRIYPRVGLTLMRDRMPFLLAQTPQRQALVRRLLAYVQKGGFSGLVLDARGVPLSAHHNFGIFLRELTAELRRTAGKTFVIVDADWEKARLKALSLSTDFVIAGTHLRLGADSYISGPPAAQSWFEARLDALLSVIPRSKLIASVGAYAIDTDGIQEAQVISVQRAWDLLGQSKAEWVFDGNSLNGTFRYTDAGGRLRRVWVLDGVTAYNQTKSALALSPAGIAIWRLGDEDPGVWLSLSRKRLSVGTMLHGLKKLAPGLGNYAKLKGHLLSERPGSKGKRKLAYNPTLGLVISQTVSKPPRTGERTMWRAVSPKLLALTFDDGPDARFTGKILDILRDKGVKATFYVIGRQVLEAPDLVKRMYDEGHDIGNHSFTHVNVFDVSATRLATELNATTRIVQSITGARTQLFRPPYAGKDFAFLDGSPTLAQQSTRLGYMIGELGADAFDYWGLTPEWMTRSAINGVVRDKEQVILLHDGGGDRKATLVALPMIIDRLRAAGYRFVTTHKLVGLPRSAVMMVSPHTATVIAKAESGIWRVATEFVGWFGNAIPIVAIVTALLGMARLGAICLLALIQFFRYPSAISCDSCQERIAVLVPAYNEEMTIAKTVSSLVASTIADKLDIIVIDDGSTDRTAETVDAAFSDNDHVRVFRKPNGGKASALNFGMDQTDAQIVVAIDGDTVLVPDAIEHLVRHFSDPSIGAVAGNVVVGNPRSLMARFQSLEYVMSQNLDRRAFQLMNAIGVVPGAIGAWRREAIVQAGGYKTDTLAEDADLTVALLRNRWRIVTEPTARAHTEVPETLGGFMKQRYRWMFGTLQVAFKNRGSLLERPSGLSLVTIPNIIIFQFAFTLLAPIMDILLVFSLFLGAEALLFGGDPTGSETLLLIATYWLIFQTADMTAAIVAIELSQRRKYWGLLLLVVVQRFCYRQLLYITAIRSLLAALKGTVVGWQKLARTGNVPTAAAAPVASFKETI